MPISSPLLTELENCLVNDENCTVKGFMFSLSLKVLVTLAANKPPAAIVALIASVIGLTRIARA